MAWKPKHDLVIRWEREKEVAFLTSQEDGLAESLMKREYNVILDSYSNQTLGLKHLVFLLLKYTQLSLGM